MSKRLEFLVFDTSEGTCGLGWSEMGIVRSMLPSLSMKIVKETFQKAGFKESSKIPSEYKLEAEKFKCHLRGEIVDYDFSKLSIEDLPKFQQKVLKEAFKIPSGKVLSYGALAEKIGTPKAARAVGTALAKNPLPLIIPCHRILGATGKMHGFSAFGGIKTKSRLLKLEGAAV